jgi:hypothetical protein
LQNIEHHFTPSAIGAATGITCGAALGFHFPRRWRKTQTATIFHLANVMDNAREGVIIRRV